MKEGNHQLIDYIVPLFFPCKKCGCNRFHQVYKQGHGLTLFVPFTKIQLAHSHRSFFLVCPVCSSINADLKKEHVDILNRGFVPRDIYTAYQQVHDFYTPASFKKIKKEYQEFMTDEQLEMIENNANDYKLEI